MFKQVVPALLMAGMAASAHALQIENGSFETGGLDGWSVSAAHAGNAEVASAYLGFAPAQGNSFAVLTSDATLSQQQSWAQGEQLIFDWAFITFEPVFLKEVYNDFALFSVFDGNGSLLSEVLLADVLGLPEDVSSTGWNTYTYTFASAGAGSIRFGVFDAVDTSFNSLLLVDNIRNAGGPSTPDIDPAPVTTVPEPGSLALFALGLAGMGLARRRAAR